MGAAAPLCYVCWFLKGIWLATVENGLLNWMGARVIVWSGCQKPFGPVLAGSPYWTAACLSPPVVGCTLPTVKRYSNALLWKYLLWYWSSTCIWTVEVKGSEFKIMLQNYEGLDIWSSAILTVFILHLSVEKVLEGMFVVHNMSAQQQARRYFSLLINILQGMTWTNKTCLVLLVLGMLRW